MNTREYKPLQNWLKTQPTTKTQIVLNFRQIEKILGRKLPPSAYKYRVWWLDQSEDTRHSQAFAWLNAGWQVEALDLENEAVTFKRV